MALTLMGQLPEPWHWRGGDRSCRLFVCRQAQGSRVVVSVVLPLQGGLKNTDPGERFFCLPPLPVGWFCPSTDMSELKSATQCQ